MSTNGLQTLVYTGQDTESPQVTRRDSSHAEGKAIGIPPNKHSIYYQSNLLPLVSLDIYKSIPLNSDEKGETQTINRTI